MLTLPTGTVTFLFTDIEGSTVRWERHPEIMRLVVARHDGLMRQAMETHQGSIFKTAGDAFYVAFTTVTDALTAAIAAQQALAVENWPEEILPLRVRMAIHTGIAEQRDHDYFGQTLNRVARILSTGHGGQILLSSVAKGLLQAGLLRDITLRDLGEHQLKDLEQAERIFQVLVENLPTEFSPLKTRRSLMNLPTQLTPFIGRIDDQQGVADLLEQQNVRLITLIGPGGIGKTRLSLQVATNVAAAFPGGVFFVDLSTTFDTEAVLSVICQALGIREVGNKTLFECVRELFSEDALLVLDNFEQLAEAAPLVRELLLHCPGLKVLVTSRAALALTGEHEYHVEPLTLPASKATADLSKLLKCEAIALFVQQATSVWPSFQLTQANAPAVVEICKKLDGLPLALELAAARIRMLSPQALLKLLNSHFQVLKDEKRDRTARQQTLHGAIAWSYNLLSEDEKKLFSQLAIFSAGCTLESIIAVCPAATELTSDLFDVLLSLIDKSLLRRLNYETDEPRFTMLYTIRHFALGELVRANQEGELRRSQLAYYLNIAEESARALTGTEQRHWLERLDSEHDNLLATLQWCAEQRESEPGARLVGALWRFWLMRGHLYEGRRQLEVFLAMQSAGSTETRARLLEGAGILSSRQKDYKAAAIYAGEALALSQQLHSQEITASSYTLLAEIAYVHGKAEAAMDLFAEGLNIRRTLGDQRGTASLLNNMGNISLSYGDQERAIALFEESQSLFSLVGDEMAQASVLNNLGEVKRRQGDLEQARLLYGRSLQLSRTLKYSWGVATVLVNLGSIICNQGDYQQALNYYRESLSLFDQLGERSGVTHCLEGIAEIVYRQNNLEYATRLLAFVETLRQSLHAPAFQLAPATQENISEKLRSALGSEVFATIWQTGQVYSLDQVLAEASQLEINGEPATGAL